MIKLGFNEDLTKQMNLLQDILKNNVYLYDTLERIAVMENKTMYLASGSIAQTVWNYQENRPLMEGISDFDIIYFDEDLSYETEDKVIKSIKSMTKDIPVKLDIKNQARVHLWIKEKWKREMEHPYTSSEDAIRSWSSTASCTGIQLVNGELKIFAPYGLNDIFGQIMRPNKEKVFKELYDIKVKKWKKNFPFLNIIEW